MQMKIKVILTSIIALATVVLVVGVGTRSGQAQEPAPMEGEWAEGSISVEDVYLEEDRGVLKVKNRTPFMVIMNIGGVRVGWMRPYRTGVIRGLVPGYHKLRAHSRYGTMSWGPRPIWVPGTWNLLY